MSHWTRLHNSQKSAKSRPYKEDEFKVAHLVNDSRDGLVLSEILFSRPFHALQRESCKQVIQCPRRLKLQEKSQLFHIIDSISIIGFLHASKMTFHTSKIQEAGALSMMPFFLKKPVVAAHTARLSLEDQIMAWKRRGCHAHITCPAVNRLSKIYAIQDIIAATYTEIIRFI